MKLPLLLTLIISLLGSLPMLLKGSETIVRERGQLWYGLMTTARVSDDFSIWNDAHYVPDAFFIVRTGLSYHIHSNTIITGGYAFLTLPGGEYGTRLEHRPWMQSVWHSPFLGTNSTLSQRLRYDFRIQEQTNGEFWHWHRVRYLIGVRLPLPISLGEGVSPFIALNNETLINFGSRIVFNHLDQNRTWAALGTTIGETTFQLGYMYRFVQERSGNTFQRNHTLLMWITHRFDFRPGKSIIPSDIEEPRMP